MHHDLEELNEQLAPTRCDRCRAPYLGTLPTCGCYTHSTLNGEPLVAEGAPPKEPPIKFEDLPRYARRQREKSMKRALRRSLRKIKREDKAAQ